MNLPTSLKKQTKAVLTAAVGLFEKNQEASIHLVPLVKTVTNVIAYLALTDPEFKDTALPVNRRVDQEDVLTPEIAPADPEIEDPDAAQRSKRRRLDQEVEATIEAGQPTAAANISIPAQKKKEK